MDNYIGIKTGLLSILLFILIIIGIVNFICIKNSVDNIKEFDSKINNIESKIDSLSEQKDSIRTKIITVDKQILNNEKHFKEVANNIIMQPSSFDSIFAREYIQKFIDERLR